VDLGFAPFEQMAIHPDPAIAVVKGLGGHGGFLCSKRVGLVFSRLALHGCVADDL
jgi:hypothetical protein